MRPCPVRQDAGNCVAPGRHKIRVEGYQIESAKQVLRVKSRAATTCGNVYHISARQRVKSQIGCPRFPIRVGGEASHVDRRQDGIRAWTKTTVARRRIVAQNGTIATASSGAGMDRGVCYVSANESDLSFTRTECGDWLDDFSVWCGR